MMSINVSLAPKWLATAMACGSPWRGARPKSVANRNVRCFEGALGKLFFGSVAEEIFRQADACAEAWGEIGCDQYRPWSQSCCHD